MGETRVDRDIRILKQAVKELGNVATGGVDITQLITDEIDKIKIPTVDCGPIEERIIAVNAKLNDAIELFAGQINKINIKLTELFEHPSIKLVVDEPPVEEPEPVVDDVPITEEKPPEA